MAMDDKGLGTGQLKAIAGAFRLERGRRRIVLLAFLQRETDHGLSARDFGEPMPANVRTCGL